MTQTWRPLLEGELAEEAWRAIRSIAEDIRPPLELDPEEAAQPATSSDWALAGGAAGTALFYAYLAQADDDEDAANAACRHLEAAMDAAARAPRAMGLWEGVMGVAWSYDHLEGRLFEAGDEPSDGRAAGAEQDDGVSEDEEFLQRFLAGHPGFDNYDLIQGLTGFGVACLEGLPRPGARRSLEKVVDVLLSQARRDGHSVRWFTPPEQLPPWQRELAPDGYFNLGVAHGMPAVATLLARCLQAGVRTAEVEPALDSLVTWMLDQRGENGFPSWVAAGQPPQSAARLAWCYGDPGIAGSLLAAATAAGRDDWRREALDIARDAATRDPKTSGLLDAGVCHGSAGLAHLFNRLHQAGGDENLRRAARHYFADTLRRRRSDRGVGGYQAWTVPRGSGDGELGWVDEEGLLTGAAGIGLCLLAAVTDIEPAWDRSLMISAASS